MQDLVLPRRYEILERVADVQDVALSSIVQPVPEAARHIDQLLREITIGGIGKLEMICGKAGSGKTTFAKSLSLFYSNVNITTYDSGFDLLSICKSIETREHLSAAVVEIVLLTDRDNPIESDDDIRVAFEQFRRVFRTKNGNVLVLWPITDEVRANQISEIAWHVGRDSLVRPATKGIMTFSGLGKEKYWEIADLTSRSLNSEGLETFGLQKEEVVKEIASAETIGEFYALLESRAAENIQSYIQVLKGKVIPKIWVVLAGDDSVELERTVRTLTQGTKNRIDADRVCEYLDDTSNQSAYLAEWRKRRTSAIFILRQLDVRLFELPPSAALAAIRCYGSDILKGSLSKKSESESNAKDALRKTRLHQVITDPDKVGTTSARATSPETKDEYNRVQVLASDRDHDLNKCVAKALTSTLTEDGVKCEITAEKRNLGDYSLQPDIQIIYSPEDVICLEPTWRTTGIEKEGDGTKRSQNTLTTGHIQKYVLEKVLEYLKVIGL